VSKKISINYEGKECEDDKRDAEGKSKKDSELAGTKMTHNTFT